MFRERDWEGGIPVRGPRRFAMMRPGHAHGGMPLEVPGLSWDPTRRFLRPAVLLLLAEQSMHGYELMGRLKEFGIGPGGMDPSMLYRLLRVMERSGLAESSLDDSGSGPARKVYNLTPEGREVLDMWMSNLDELSELLGRFRERYEKLR
ncbi:MAG: PadR family transcriptional regulator [Actinobacteria bacterium]|nr:PadR family transcriptional regulator [Actinomycetota bacterium]